MFGVIVQAKNSAVRSGIRYRIVEATTSTQTIRAPMTRTSGKMRSSRSTGVVEVRVPEGSVAAELLIIARLLLRAIPLDRITANMARQKRVWDHYSAENQSPLDPVICIRESQGLLRSRRGGWVSRR